MSSNAHSAVPDLHPSCHIVLLDSYEGDDSFVRCGDSMQEYLYCIVSVASSGAAEIVDNGYRTIEEAVQAWPRAIKPTVSGTGTT